MGMLPDIRDMISAREYAKIKTNRMQWYGKYKVAATGEEIGGSEIRQFVDNEKDKPKYMRIYKTYNGTSSQTYLDSELVPVGDPV